MESAVIDTTFWQSEQLFMLFKRIHCHLEQSRRVTGQERSFIVLQNSQISLESWAKSSPLLQIFTLFQIDSFKLSWLFNAQLHPHLSSKFNAWVSWAFECVCDLHLIESHKKGSHVDAVGTRFWGPTSKRAGSRIPGWLRAWKFILVATSFGWMSFGKFTSLRKPLQQQTKFRCRKFWTYDSFIS